MGNETKTLRRLGVVSTLLVGLLLFASPAAANPISGVGKILFGILQVPLSTLVGTFSGPPILGTAMGAVNGTFQGAGLIASGALELAMDGVALAKMAAPFVLPFLF